MCQVHQQYLQDNMIRKATFAGFTRYDLIVNGKSEILIDVTDNEAKSRFDAMIGTKEQVKSFSDQFIKNSGMTQSYI